MAPAPGPILLVEDDADLRDIIVEILAVEGLEVVATRDGAEALDWLASGQRPMLVLLDFWMPRMNGWEFLEQLHARPDVAALPVLALSTSVVEHPNVRTTLRKPFDVAVLVDRVRELLGTTRPA